MKRIYSLLLFLICILSTAGTEPLNLSLQEAISLSLKASPDLFLRERTLALSHLSYRLGFYAYAPLVSLSFSDSRTVYYSNPDTLQTSLGAQLSIPLYRGGRRRLQEESSRLSLNTTQEELLTTRAETTITCMQAYYQVLIAQEKQKLLQNMVSLAREQQRIAEVEYRTGAIRELDLVEIALQVQEMELSLLEAERSLRESEYTLKKLLGVPPEAEIVLTDTLPPSYSGLNLPLDPEPLIQIALSHNKELKALYFKMRSLDIQKKVLSSQWLPDVDLQTSLRVSGEEFPLSLPGFSVKVSISLPSAPVPLVLDTSFDHTSQQSHGRTISAQLSTPRTLEFLISPQELALQETLLLKQKGEKEKDLAFSLTQLLEEYHWARRQLDLLRKGISLEERKYEILETEVELGKTTRIDLVKAQNDLLQQKLSELNYVLQLLMRERNMERILGITPGSLISLEGEE